jgi:anti-sigma28 factor (negative regulator of flagellin synthesis)
MKITSSDTEALSGAAPASSAASGSGTARARTAAESRNADYAQLSSLSAQLRGQTTEGTQARVESIEATVASGRYKTDANAISGQIIEQSMRSSSATA